MGKNYIFLIYQNLPTGVKAIQVRYKYYIGKAFIPTKT